MLKNFCGKNCADCTQKEIMNCPGCLDGPGKQFYGDCVLAKCCREKGHETCETCSFSSTCTALKNCETMPEERKRNQEAELAKKAAELAKKEAFAADAAVLGKWLTILFWLIIPSVIIGVMTTDTIASWYPNLYFIGQILSAVISGVYGFILLQLTKQNYQYKTAGMLCLITAAASGVVALISGTGEAPEWTMVITLPAAVVSLVGEYNEFMAHSSVVSFADRELSLKWEKLWKWTIGCYGALFGSIIIMLIASVLGLIVLLGGLIGLAVVSIAKLVYVYNTAKAFREYSPEGV